MTQAYSNPKRESESYALPDAEVWQARTYNSKCCLTAHPEDYVTACKDQLCLTCERPAKYTPSKFGWYYWYCSPGCLPDSNPFGPFDTEAEALEDMRKNDGNEGDDDYE